MLYITLIKNTGTCANILKEEYTMPLPIHWSRHCQESANQETFQGTLNFFFLIPAFYLWKYKDDALT
jgi:hypothetical protein